MTTAVFINPDEIRQIQHRVANPSRFLEIGHRFQRAAKAINQNWENLPKEDRAYLLNLAYNLIEPRQGIAELFIKLWFRAYMLFIKAIGQEKEFFYCLDELDFLIDSILDGIERENDLHKQVLSDTLEEVISNPETGEPGDGKQGSRLLAKVNLYLGFICVHPRSSAVNHSKQTLMQEV